MILNRRHTRPEIARPGVCIFIAGVALSIAAHPSSSHAQDLPQISLNELGYQARHWTVDDGLPSGHLESVSLGPDGYLWVGTRAGLARFDGIGFDIARQAPSGQPGGFVSYADLGATLWITRANRNLAVLEQGEFRSLGEEDGLPPGAIVRISNNAAGESWLLCIPPEGGAAALTYRGGRFETVATGDFSWSTLAVDDDGDVWAIHYAAKGIWTLAAGTANFIHLPLPATSENQEPQPRKFFRDQEGRLTLLTDLGLLVRGEEADGSGACDLIAPSRARTRASICSAMCG